MALLGGNQIVAFSKTEKEAVQLSWDMPVANTKIFIAGLQPDSLFSVEIVKSGLGSIPYRLSVSKSTTGSLRSSAQGTLRIDGSAP